MHIFYRVTGLCMVPELPEEIDSWPLVIPVSVQLPKELNVLEALFTVEPAASAAATFQQIPESQHYEGTVNADNVVTGSLSFWEAGPHLIRCVFTVSLDGHKQSMSHNISIDTSNVRVKADKNCPVHESGHQWKFEWAEAHPHYGRLICDCGAEQDAPEMPTVTMPSCCECLGSHDWAEPIRIGNAFQHTCLRCGLKEEMTPPANVQSFYNVIDQMTDMQKRSADYPQTNGVSAWETVAAQATDKLLDKGFVITSEALDKYSDMFGSIKDAVLPKETWDDIQVALWEDILIQMLNDEEQESTPEREETDLIKTLNNSWELFEGFNDERFEKQISALKESADKFGKQIQSLNQRADSLVPSGHNKLIEHLEEQAKSLSEELESTNNTLSETEKFQDNSNGATGKMGKALKIIAAIGNGLDDASKLAQRNNEFERMLRNAAKNQKTLNQIISVCKQNGNTTLMTAAKNVSDRLNQEIENRVNQFLSEVTTFLLSTGESLVEELAKYGVEKLTEKAVEKIIEGAGSDALVPLKVIELAAGGAKVLLNWNDAYEDALELMTLSTMDASLNVLGTLRQEDSEAMAKVWGALQTRGCEKAEEFLNSWEDARGLSTKEFGLGKDRLDWALDFLENDKTSYLTFTRQCP